MQPRAYFTERFGNAAPRRRAFRPLAERIILRPQKLGSPRMPRGLSVGGFEKRGNAHLAVVDGFRRNQGVFDGGDAWMRARGFPFVHRQRSYCVAGPADPTTQRVERAHTRCLLCNAELCGLPIGSALAAKLAHMHVHACWLRVCEGVRMCGCEGVLG